MSRLAEVAGNGGKRETRRIRKNHMLSIVSRFSTFGDMQLALDLICYRSVATTKASKQNPLF